MLPHPTTTALEPDEPAIEPRNAFLPPRYLVPPEPSAAPIATLADPFGEEAARGVRARLRLSYQGQTLRLQAEVDELNLTAEPSLGVDHPRFWQQDHVELRLLPDPAEPLAQVQVLLAASGKALLNRAGQPPAELPCQVRCDADRWSLQAELSVSELGMPPIRPGVVFHGLLAHVRWGGGWPDIACSSPAPLGFSQADRFGQFVFAQDSPPLSLQRLRVVSDRLVIGDNPVDLTLSNFGGQPVEGMLRISRDEGPDAVGQSLQIPCRLGVGYSTTLRTHLSLSRPRYTRYRVGFLGPEGRYRELGAVSLRAAPPTSPRIGRPVVDGLRHPYLLFDEAGLRRLRQKADHPMFARIAEQLRPSQGDYESANLPETPEAVDISFGPRDAAWSRVARESMLRAERGEAKRSAHRRIWDRLSGPAKQAVRDVSESVGRDPEAVTRMAQGFTELLDQPDLYDPKAFEGVALDQQVRGALAEPGKLTQHQLRLSNRALLQSAIECVKAFKMDLAGQAANLAMKCLLVGPDEQLLKLSGRCIRAAQACMIPPAHSTLHTGMLCGSLARAYDLIEPWIGDEDHQAWIGLMRRMLHLWLSSARARHWDHVCIPNANPVSNAGGGQLALCLLRELPTEAGEALYLARKFIHNWLDYCSGPFGGNTEGAQYWQYGTSQFLPFAIALERRLGHDDGLLSHPAIVHTMNMVKLGLSNDGAMHGVNDTIPVPVGQEIAWFCAARFDDPFALWYGDHAARDFAKRKEQGRPTPYRASPLMSLLYRPEVDEATDQPPLPTAVHLPDIEYGTLRSGVNHDCELVVGLKGSRPPYTHHNQPDTGAFYVHLHGERLLIDPGYYKGQPTDHSLPIIDGVGPSQPSGYTGKLSLIEGEEASCLICDATKAYRGAAQRVRRHLLLWGPDAVVLVDDIIPAEGSPGLVQAQYQCGGLTQGPDDEGLIAVKGEKATLVMALLGQPGIAPKLHEERDLHDVHWGYHFAECRHFPVTAEYTADAERPLVSVFLDAKGHDRGPSLTEEPWGLKLELGGRAPLRLLRSRGGWVADLTPPPSPTKPHG